MRYDFLILNGAVAIALLVLGFVAFVNDRRLLVNRLFLAFTVSIGIWLIAAAISNDTTNSPTVSLYGNYVVFAFSYLTSYLLLWFTVLITPFRRISAILRRLFIPVVIIGILSATPLTVAGVNMQGDVYAVEFGPFIVVYVLALGAMLIASVIVLAKGFKKTSGRIQDQIGIMLLTLGIAIPVLLATQFVLPAITGSFAITDIGIMAMVLPVVGLYTSVIRHGLFDIRLVAVRTFAYVLSLLVLGGLYYVVAYGASVFLFQDHAGDGAVLNPFNIILALALAFIFQPIKIFFDHVTNSIFYRDTYKSEEFFALLSNVLGTTTDIRDLLERAADIIGMTLKSEQTFFYVREDGRHVVAGLGYHENLLVSEADHLDGYVKKARQRIIITDGITGNHAIATILKRRKIALLLPLFHGDGIVGYLCLGEQRGGRYTRRDLRVLETISDELVIAIQNALSLEAVREINATLQDKIDGATRDLRSKNERLKQLDNTKDEFISMASHQLRTPLTSVKGYVSMILDGDAGPVTDAQRRFLEEAFDSSVRMAGIIGDFLNVSRLQTGKFMLEKTEVDLADIVESEVEHLQNTARMRGLEIRYKKPKNFPVVLADKSKIEQVMMNFMDNALFYAPNSKTVDVSLTHDDGKATFTVRDHGIGVPKSEQAGLFTKFFRATNARKQRPDGTGVGIFLAKKVVTAHHGDIIFTSEEGKGSTFGFSIPLMREPVTAKKPELELVTAAR